MHRTMSRAVRRHSAIGLTSQKLAKLRELASRSTAARFEFVADYWDVEYASRVIRSPRALVETRRRCRTLQRPGLTTHQSEMAFKDALWMLRVSWAQALDRARWRIYRNPGLNEC